MTPLSEMGTSQMRQEIVRLQVKCVTLMTALQQAECDLDIALERVRGALAMVTEANDDDR